MDTLLNAGGVFFEEQKTLGGQRIWMQGFGTLNNNSLQKWKDFDFLLNAVVVFFTVKLIRVTGFVSF